ncbi:tryptophan synthase subunit alpha [Legionella adelaidensis]|uniref:Tryptophan synthase alpha chain n=1 Tax=Legionella adelaidensis TaxID=45056 RepID=A0A0W0R4K7_9GAMM|nr:tryptophan synthase subunit alpha [Legionella adelaidensis]KTC65950.1 tryptophan synthase subunit alpha [Legionella adelaidensis]
MNRIDEVLKEAQKTAKKILSPYITAGDPIPEETVKLMHTLVKAGANILELGIPFSDPMAEGPVIQQAMERALAHQISCEEVFSLVREFRKSDPTTPIILMGYVNPIEQYGYEEFAKEAKEAGVDGTILVDLPPEESEEIIEIWERNNLYNIFLCSPTTSDERMKLINQLGKGYLYYVSLKGVTGANTFNVEEVKRQYLQRQTKSTLPILVGFGIKSPEMAAAVADFADGVVVGAELITRIFQAYTAKKDMHAAAKELIAGMREAMG